jgi:hypothetical protein
VLSEAATDDVSRATAGRVVRLQRDAKPAERERRRHQSRARAQKLLAANAGPAEIEIRQGDFRQVLGNLPDASID